MSRPAAPPYGLHVLMACLLLLLLQHSLVRMTHLSDILRAREPIWVQYAAA